MRKKMLSLLLVLVLFLSIAPIPVFASSITVTMTQQTTGEFADVNKEFVYYIRQTEENYPTHLLEIDTSLPNVEPYTIYKYYCDCGEIFYAIDPDYHTKWEEHYRRYNDDGTRNPNGCGKANTTNKTLGYKISLKNGEKINITVMNPSRIEMYAILEDNYTLSKLRGTEKTSISQPDRLTRIVFSSLSDSEKLTMVQTYGDEDTNTNGTSFPDVPSDSEYAKAIEYVNKKGVMVGDDQGKFNPDNIVNRSEMATIVCRVLGQTENLSKSNVFNDVPVEHWANAYIGRASTLGIVNGYGDGRFGPSDPVTCEQSVTMIIRSIGESDKANAYGGYPNGYLLVAKEKNLLEGIHVEQEQGMSRGAVAMLLYNYYISLDNPSTSEDGHTHNWETRYIEEVGHKEVQYVTVWTYRCNCGLTWKTDHEGDETVLAELHDHMLKTRHGRYLYGYETGPEVVYVVDVPAHDEVFCTSCGAIK